MPHVRFGGVVVLAWLVFGGGARLAHAEPVTEARVAALPAAEQASWREYLARSRATAAGDAAALQAEVTASGLAVARRAPDGPDFKPAARSGDAWFASEEAGRLAEVVLSYQTPSGGWSKHTGYSHGPRSRGMQWSSQSEPGRSPHYLATFDNGATTREIQFLAEVAHATGREDCRAGVRRGVDFLLAAQYPNGGWPQVYPLEGGYHDDITFNDDVQIHVLEVLHAVASAAPAWAWIEADRRERAAAALAAGLRSVLAAQVVIDGRRTVWCAQHDPLTLQPASARKFEPATLSGMESARVLAFLMKLPRPAPEIVAAIESGLAWMEQAKITGLARVKRDGKTAYEPDPASTEVYWARFYALSDGRPVFPGRDGVLYATFAEMAAKNSLGYDFYTTLPASIVTNGQKKWRKQLALEAKR